MAGETNKFGYEMIDVSGSFDGSHTPVVQINVNSSGTDIWVNVDGICRFRATRVNIQIEQMGKRMPIILRTPTSIRHL
ncbi:MAG: hypothetical protein ACREJN_11755 [Nitrospiraceae bacterium]